MRPLPPATGCPDTARKVPNDVAQPAAWGSLACVDASDEREPGSGNLEAVFAPVRSAFLDALKCFVDASDSEAESAGWHNATVIPPYLVGELVGHMYSTAAVTERYLDAEAPTEQPIPAAEYYARALPQQNAADVHAGIRDRAARLSERGPAALTRDAAALHKRLSARLQNEPAERAVAVMGGVVLTLDSYLEWVRLFWEGRRQGRDQPFVGAQDDCDRPTAQRSVAVGRCIRRQPPGTGLSQGSSRCGSNVNPLVATSLRGSRTHLESRIVELIVHLDDLATTLDADFELPEQAAATAVTHLVDVCRARNGDPAVLRALSRQERDDGKALRAL